MMLLDHCRRIARHSWGLGLNLLFPPCCTFCDDETDPVQAGGPILCSQCIQRLLPGDFGHCARCGAVNRKLVDDSRCVECRDKKLWFDAVKPFGIYRGDLQKAVIRMKQPSGQALAMSVGLLMAERLDLADRLGPPDAVTCVPKFWLRRIVRGANSAETLMSAVADRHPVTALPGLLICRRNTSKQSMLSQRQRQQNVRGAFTVAAGYDLADAHILVVDDIMTTGATANEVARVLRKAGAGHVTIATVGRAVSSY